MHDENANIVLSWQDYYSSARNAFLEECCFSPEQINVAAQKGQNVGLVMLELNTRGENDTIAQYPGYKNLLKSVFLMRPDFRKNIIGYYRQQGYNWVDIIALERDSWRIFLWKKNQYQ